MDIRSLQLSVVNDLAVFYFKGWQDVEALFSPRPYVACLFFTVKIEEELL